MKASHSHRIARTAWAALGAVALAGCGKQPGYPHDWPALAWAWKCPELAGQWRLGGQPGTDMDAIRDWPLVRIGGKTYVPWDGVSISLDGERNMTLRFGRNGTDTPGRYDLLPATLQGYAGRLHYLRLPSPDAGKTRYETRVDSAHYQCSDNKLAFEAWATSGGHARVALSRDRQGQLVAEVVDSGDTATGGALRRRWAHWPAITPSEFATVESTPHAPGQVFDAGPAEFGQPGVHDVETARPEVALELEDGTRLVDLQPAGSGAVIATIEAADAAGIRRALDRAAAARKYLVDLRRYDPVRAGAVQADVLLVPRGSAMRLNMLVDQLAPQAVADAAGPPAARPSSSMTLVEAQAEVLARMPDSIVFRSLTISPRGYKLQARADNARAVATLMQRLSGEGRFATHPETPDQVALDAEGAFELELTPRR